MLQPICLRRDIDSLQPFDRDDFAERMHAFSQAMLADALRAKEALITQVLEAHLQRAPAIEDYTLVCLARHVDRDPDIEQLNYADLRLGWITTTIDLGKVTFTFRPG